MSNKVGFVDNSNGVLAHYNMLEAIRHVCGGFGDLGAIGGTRTGTGSLTGLEASPTSVTETWTLTCTATAIDGGTFSVVGSVSGIQADATVGTAYDNGLIKFTVADGATDYALNDTFTIPVTQGAAAAKGDLWQVLRYDTAPANRELILKGHGLSGTEEIFVGFRTYQDAGADYYNLLAATFTGYTAGNTFDTQPGYRASGVPAHNQRIDYWLTLNAQRIALAMKVGTPVYESCYVGKFLPYARPTQFPYPVVCGGMLTGASATRFSETTHRFYLGWAADARMAIRNNTGWVLPVCYPWGNNAICEETYSQANYYQMRDTGGYYPLTPIVLHDNSANVYGELDGIFHISGFNNAVENTLTIGSENFIVIQNVSRTSHIDYYAMRLDA